MPLHPTSHILKILEIENIILGAVVFAGPASLTVS